MADVDSMPDDMLQKELIQLGYPACPVTDKTRSILKKKLKELLTKRPKSSTKSIAAYSSGEEDSAPEYSPTKASTRVSVGPRLTRTPKKSTSVKSSGVSGRSPLVPETIPTPQADASSWSDTDEFLPRKQSPVKGTRTYGSFTPSRNLFSVKSLAVSESESPHVLYKTSTSSIDPESPFLSKVGRRLSTMSSPNGSQATIEKDQTYFRNWRQTTRMPANADSGFVVQNQSRWWSTVTISKLLLLFLAIFFVFLFYKYAGMHPTKDPRMQFEVTVNDASNNLSFCVDDLSVNCMTSSEIYNAFDALKVLVPQLHEQAAKAVCKGYNVDGALQTTSDGELVPGSLSFDQVKNLLYTTGINDISNTVGNLRILARRNPQWGVTALENGFIISNPVIPYWCGMYNRITGGINALVSFGMVVSTLLVIIWAFKKYQEQNALHQRRILCIVNRIADTLSCRLQEDINSGTSSQGPTFLPVDILRDQLIPEADRNRLSYLWQCTLDYIAKNDGRFRLESRRYAGEEVLVLTWLDELPRIATPESSFVASDIASSSGVSSPARRQRVWQGQAFGTVEGSVNSLNVSPTPCLKIRHMFNMEGITDQNENENWPERIKNAILEKCNPGVNILHISVDKHSSDGCVYVKCASPADAGQAYRALHGWWYDGQLVTVKYLRLERYHERFPDSVDMCIPLRPSNNEKLSLQGHFWQSNLEC